MNLIGNTAISFHSLDSSFIKILLMSDGIQVVHFQNNYCFLEKKIERQVSIDNHLSFVFLFSPKNIHLLFIEKFGKNDIQHTWKK